jgi:ATP-binding cassette subfamily C protein CydD
MFNKDLIRNAREELKWLISTVLFGSLNGVLVIWQAWIISSVINGVFLAGKSLIDVRESLIKLLFLIIARFFFMWAGEYSGAVTAIKIKSNLRKKMVASTVVSGDISDTKQQSGAITAIMVEGIEKLDGYFKKYLPQIAFSVVIPFAILFVVFPMDLISGIVLILTAPLIPIFMILIGKQADKMTHEQWGLLSNLSSHFLDVIQGLKTIKVFGKTKAAEEKLKDSSLQYAEATLNVLKVAFLSALVLELLASLSTAVVAVEIGLRLLYAKMAFREALFILVLAPEFYLPLRKLGLVFHSGVEGIAAAESIFDYLKKTISKPDLAGGDINFLNNIEFKNVSYQYLDRDVPSVDSISFEIKKGEMIAIVGESGAGKSTVANLLMGLLTPQSGNIRVDGSDLNKKIFERWADKITWVSQSPFLKSGTIAENIKIAKYDANADEITFALDKAMILNEINNLPDGIDTKIGEKGVRLSAGQRQRIALARAFLRDTEIMVFDETGSI